MNFHVQWEVVRIIIEVNEAIVQQEPSVTFAPVRVMDRLASLNIANCVDDKALSLVAVSPTGFTRPLVIKHISVGDKAISFVPVHRDAENATGH